MKTGARVAPQKEVPNEVYAPAIAGAYLIYKDKMNKKFTLCKLSQQFLTTTQIISSRNSPKKPIDLMLCLSYQ